MSARQRQLLASAPAGRAAESPRSARGLSPTARPTPGGLLLRLQRSHGNQFVQRLVAGGAATVAPDLLFRRGTPSLSQLAAEERVTEGRAVAPVARLTVGAADDPAEAAADRLAGNAVAGWSAAPAGGAAPTGGRPAAPAGGGPRVHRRATNADPGGYLDGETSRAVGAAQRTGGTPLGATTRAHMETVLGTGLSGVRVHADATARDLCDTVGAHAFTVGRHVFFRAGLPDERSAAGRHLLAHELAHVTQRSVPGVIRRTYLDGKHDWIRATTRRKLFSRRIRERPEVLQAVDNAVTAVRQAYDGGYMVMLNGVLAVLVERIQAWKAARQGHRRRMLDNEIDRLHLQAEDLQDDIRLWQGDGYRDKVTKHQQQLANVQQWLIDGSAQNQQVRLRNSVEWILQGKTKLFVLTETADSRYRAHVLLRGQGKESTVNDAAFFPVPTAADGNGAVGEQSAGTRRYNRNNAADTGNVVLNKHKKGWNDAGYIALTEDGTVNQGTFFQTLRHEVQHDADKFRGPELSAAVTAAHQAGDGPEELFQKALREYKTEYRAHFFQGVYPNAEPDFARTGGQTRRWGHNWDNRQLSIFEHIREQYPSIGAEVGRGTTARQRRFIREARAYLNPNREGFNTYSSIRIDDLYLAVRQVPLHNQDAGHASMAAVLTAAGNLNADDLTYLRAGNQGTGTQEEAFMLNAMIEERLDGLAFDAFRAALPP